MLYISKDIPPIVNKIYEYFLVIYLLLVLSNIPNIIKIKPAIEIKLYIFKFILHLHLVNKNFIIRDKPFSCIFF